MPRENLIDLRAVGERVLVLRRRAGVSQEQLAQAAGMDNMTISRLERGVKKRLDSEQIARLAQAFAVTTDHLLGLEQERRDATHNPTLG